MGVRPKVYHMIGINTDLLPNSLEIFKDFYNKHHEDDFVDIARTLLYKIDEKDFIDEYIDKELHKFYTFDILHEFNREQRVIGILPVFHLSESSLYAHDLLYSMIEANLIEDKPTAIKIPYRDLSPYIGLNVEELRKSDLEILKRREVLYYNGSWGREYPNHSIDWYDDDLEFAYLYFKNMGIDLEQKDLDRYIVFEWC